jgi:hypothetical protein
VRRLVVHSPYNSLVQQASTFVFLVTFLLTFNEHTSLICYRINYGRNKFTGPKGFAKLPQISSHLAKLFAKFH